MVVSGRESQACCNHMMASNNVTVSWREKATRLRSLVWYCSLTAYMIPASQGWSFTVVFGGRNTNLMLLLSTCGCTVQYQHDDFAIGKPHLVVDDVKPLTEQFWSHPCFFVVAIDYLQHVQVFASEALGLSRMASYKWFLLHCMQAARSVGLYFFSTRTLFTEDDKTSGWHCSEKYARFICIVNVLRYFVDIHRELPQDVFPKHLQQRDLRMPLLHLEQHSVCCGEPWSFLASHWISWSYRCPAATKIPFDWSNFPDTGTPFARAVQNQS